MLIRFKLKSVATRAGLLLVSTGFLLLLLKMVHNGFIVGVLSDGKVSVDKKSLTLAVEKFPNSARLSARLAKSEMAFRDLASSPDYESAEKHVRRAIVLSPNNYNYRLLLAKVSESRGDLSGAEEILRDALELAPNSYIVHWEVANLLIRRGKAGDSLEHFRFAVNLNPYQLPITLDLMWSVMNQDVSILTAIAGGKPKPRLKLAVFLAGKMRLNEAAAVFEKVDKTAALSEPDTSMLFDIMIEKGFPMLASKTWTRLITPDAANVERPAIWNGDFENVRSDLPQQFNWKLKESDYAQVGITGSTARSGTNSLMLSFTGRDTTRLENEVKRLLVLRPGASYRLEYFVKTEGLRTPEGPRVVIVDSLGSTLAQSSPIPAGSGEWKPAVVNFTAPRKANGDGSTVFILVRRKPLYDYDEPTRGRIWFDDFTISTAANE